MASRRKRGAAKQGLRLGARRAKHPKTAKNDFKIAHLKVVYMAKTDDEAGLLPIYGSYGQRRTAEAIADRLRSGGMDTQIEEQNGNHIVRCREGKRIPGKRVPLPKA